MDFDLDEMGTIPVVVDPELLHGQQAARCGVTGTVAVVRLGDTGGGDDGEADAKGRGSYGRRQSPSTSTCRMEMRCHGQSYLFGVSFGQKLWDIRQVSTLCSFPLRMSWRRMPT